MALALGAFSATAVAADQAPTPNITPALAKTFRAAQEASKARKWSEVIAKAQEALATPNRKPDDTYYANYLLFTAYHAGGNVDEERKALRGVVESGFLSPDQQAPFIRALMAMAFDQKDYDAAIEHGTRLIKNGDADPAAYTVVGQSYYQKGQFAESANFFKSLVSDQIKRGQTPLEQNIVLMQSAYQKLNNRDGATDALETLVVYYPKPNYWEALLYSVRGNSALQPRQKLQVYRLMWATGTLKLGTDFSKFAELATYAGLPAEAQKVFEAGLKSNVFNQDADKSRAERLMASAAKAADNDKADLSKQEASAAAAATGEQDVSVGMAYYSYGDADKAIEALQRGLSKGNLKDDLLIEASLTLGMAQLRVKDKTSAQKTFRSIKTADANMQRIANLWALYAS